MTTMAGKSKVGAFMIGAFLALSATLWADTAPVIGDAQTNSGAPLQKNGAAPTILIRRYATGPVIRGFARFDLSAFPAGATIERAIMRLWIVSVTLPGTIEVGPVMGTWTETTLNEATAPPVGVGVANLAVSKTTIGRYSTMDVTTLVQDWLDGDVPNNGVVIAGVPGTSVLATIATKETPGRGPELELYVASAGPQGEQGPEGDPGQSVYAYPEPLGPNCIAGGSRFDALNATTYACNGPKGDRGLQGDQGPPGIPGQSVVSFPEPAGANCAQGGTRLVSASGTTYACNGDRGMQGDQGPVGPPGSSVTLHSQQIALLRWYESTSANTEVLVGSGATGIAFDGYHMWVANYGSNDLAKVRASDGAVIGTYPAGAGPSYLAFDGSHVWVTKTTGETIGKFQASDGALIANYPTGHAPLGVCFDGAYVWAVNSGDATVQRWRASDGAASGIFPVATNPQQCAFDGQNIWVTNYDSSSVTKLRASDGALAGTYPVATGPFGLAYDGVGGMWVTLYNGSSVVKLRTSDGALLATYNVSPKPQGIAFDGFAMWVANRGSGTVTKLGANDGSLIGTYVVATPQAIASDGANVWVTSGPNIVKR